MKILLAEGDQLERKKLQSLLEENGYEVEPAEDGLEALDHFYGSSALDLIILDLKLAGISGLEVLQQIRQYSQVAVLLLTAAGDAKGEVEGLRMGAQDSIAKPYHPQVLLARIEVLLRSKNPLGGEQIRLGRMLVDKMGCRVYVDGKVMPLTNKEYQLLVYLLDNQNIALTREQILERVWGFDYEGDIRTIDTHVKMLRTDLGECGSYIRTIRGVGYMLSYAGSLS
ncbi:MAG: response regulator transcription factor [Blautia sp.]